MIFAVFDVHIAVNCVKTAALYIYICCFVIACATLVILDHSILVVSELFLLRTLFGLYLSVPLLYHSRSFKVTYFEESLKALRD